jgi:hypothetical protein
MEFYFLYKISKINKKEGRRIDEITNEINGGIESL